MHIVAQRWALLQKANAQLKVTCREEDSTPVKNDVIVCIINAILSGTFVEKNKNVGAFRLHNTTSAMVTSETKQVKFVLGFIL